MSKAVVNKGDQQVSQPGQAMMESKEHSASASGSVGVFIPHMLARLTDEIECNMRQRESEKLHHEWRALDPVWS